MCQHPEHQVNVSRKGVLCALDYSKFSEMPCIKAWRNWPTLLAKEYCFRFNSGIIFLLIANDLEKNKSVCRTMIASFAKVLVE